jgi:glycosyltransferase involved in cell wall biosynthesis
LNLLLFNLRTDESDSTHGFTTGWINALARYCDRITVITMYAGAVDVAANVEVLSLGKEHGFSEPRRLVRFYKLAFDVVHQHRIDVAFAHMTPLFAVLFAPIAKRKRIPVLLWYAHRSVTPTLRLAHRLVDECVSPSPESFRLRSSKVRVIGHGVDTRKFTPPSEENDAYELTAVTVGRLTRIKNVHQMLEAVAAVRRRGFDIRLEVTGGPQTAGDVIYEREVLTLVRRLGVTDAVTFAGPLPFTEIAARYRRGGLFLNLCDSAFDKAIIEAMLCGCIPLSWNAGFRELAERRGFADLVPAENPEAVADRLIHVIQLPGDTKAEVRKRLREAAIEEHSLDSLAAKLTDDLRRLHAETVN